MRLQATATDVAPALEVPYAPTTLGFLTGDRKCLHPGQKYSTEASRSSLGRRSPDWERKSWVNSFLLHSCMIHLLLVVFLSTTWAHRAWLSPGTALAPQQTVFKQDVNEGLGELQKVNTFEGQHESPDKSYSSHSKSHSPAPPHEPQGRSRKAPAPCNLGLKCLPLGRCHH